MSMINGGCRGRYRVTVISKSTNPILWNIRPIDSKYSLPRSGLVDCTIDERVAIDFDDTILDVHLN